jgi:general stress protein 26
MTELSKDEIIVLPQGDPRLIQHEVAQRLLVSDEVARLAYLGADGTPRVIPIAFHWTGDELVLATFAGVEKVRALRRNPAVALTIDAKDVPPLMLLLRGNVTVEEREGILPEYVLMQNRYYGEERTKAELEHVDQPGVRMVRIGLRPSWVGVIDFRTRYPGGLTRADFAKTGQSEAA